METVVIYHGDCFDGFGAAWVAKKALNYPYYMIPRKYGQQEHLEIPEPKDANVYILDFSFPRASMVQLSKIVKKLVVLDHHKTAQADCEGLDFCTFDMNRSGAGLTWDYFYPEIPRPPLINYVEDRDLWKFKLPDSDAIHAYISSWPKDYNVWDWLDKRLTENFEECLNEGKAILRFKDQKVEEMVKEAILVKGLFKDDFTVPLVNCTYQFGSDVAMRLLDIYPNSPY